MKKCPFCAGEVQDAAVKCKHCQKIIGNADAVNLSAFATGEMIEVRAMNSLKKWTRRLCATVIVLIGVLSLVGSGFMFFAGTTGIGAVFGAVLITFSGLLLIDPIRDQITKGMKFKLISGKRILATVVLLVIGAFLNGV